MYRHKGSRAKKNNKNTKIKNILSKMITLAFVGILIFGLSIMGIILVKYHGYWLFFCLILGLFLSGLIFVISMLLVLISDKSQHPTNNYNSSRNKKLKVQIIGRAWRWFIKIKKIREVNNNSKNAGCNSNNSKIHTNKSKNPFHAQSLPHAKQS